MRSNRESSAISLFLFLSLGSILYGKLFCGYYCPFHAYDMAVTYIFGKAKIKRISCPAIYNYRPLLLCASTLILALLMIKATAPYTSIKFKVPVLLIAFFFLTFFEPKLWHRYLCPFSLIMRLPALTRPLLPKIDEDKCKRCKACEKACPTDSITIGKDEIDLHARSCILCYRCEDSCKYDSINV